MSKLGINLLLTISLSFFIKKRSMILGNSSVQLLYPCLCLIFEDSVKNKVFTYSRHETNKALGDDFIIYPFCSIDHIKPSNGELRLERLKDGVGGWGCIILFGKTFSVHIDNKNPIVTLQQ